MSSIHSNLYALVDCNNFYASCERIFNPALNNKAIVVLSNNDGCIIARSEQAKALGIPMGAPFFKYKDFCRQHGVVVFSSNYSLYGDISQRVMDVLRQACPEVEVYSIDEAFLRLDRFDHGDLLAFATGIHDQIKQWIGIPVSIGIAPTKTLAKLANYIAKKENQKVVNLCDRKFRETLLGHFEIGKIWGIGKRLSIKLNHLGIYTVKQLADCNSNRMRQQFGVVLERIILELNGEACLSLEEIKPKQNIIASRSFGKTVTDYQALSEAISFHVARAALRLREQNSKAQGLYVFINTNLFSQYQPPYCPGIVQTFVEPTADARLMIQVAKQGLKKIFLPKYQYQKAGIMLMNITQPFQQQNDFFSENDSQKSDQLMMIMDKINTKIGKGSIFIAAEGIKKNWQARFDLQSNHYTTCWKDLAQVIA